MNLINWTPFRDLDGLLSRYAAEPWVARQREQNPEINWRPATSIIENSREFLIRCDLPAVRREDIQVSVDAGTLTVKGARREESAAEDERLHRREACYGSFSRSFALPDNVDISGIAAQTRDGVLELKIPKLAEDRPRSIEVAVN